MAIKEYNYQKESAEFYEKLKMVKGRVKALNGGAIKWEERY